MKRGDIIIFTNTELGFNRQFSVIIKYIKKYKTYHEYLINETLRRCLPGIDTIEEGLNVCYKYYTKEDETKYGINAIRVKVIK